MKKMLILICFLGIVILGGCCRSEKEPIVEENQRLIIPPDFGKIPN